MANNLTDTAEAVVLDWLTGNNTTLPVLPLVVRLMITNGSESVAGTEVTGDTYEEQPVTFAASSTTAGVTTAKNNALVSWAALDTTTAKTITGYEIWDSGAVPRRFTWEAFSPSVAVAANEGCQFNINGISLGLE
jgi:hypothetical protein